MIKIFLEAHDALLFYDNAIDNVLKDDSEHVTTIRNEIKKIQKDIKRNIICRYRKALQEFCHEWQSSSVQFPLEFSPEFHRSPSLNFKVHLAIILHPLEQWMNQTYYVITNLENKFY